MMTKRIMQTIRLEIEAAQAHGTFPDIKLLAATPTMRIVTPRKGKSEEK